MLYPLGQALLVLFIFLVVAGVIYVAYGKGLAHLCGQLIAFFKHQQKDIMNAYKKGKEDK